MKDLIYIVDPVSQELQKLAPISFTDIGIKERQDLQSWITHHPELMGEALLIITSEFSSFDKVIGGSISSLLTKMVSW